MSDGPSVNGKNSGVLNNPGSRLWPYPHGADRAGGTSGFTGAAAVAAVRDHAWLVGKAAVGAAHRDRLVGAFLDAGGAFAPLHEQAAVQVHHGQANHMAPLVRQRKAGDGSAGTDLVAAVAILAAVIVAEAQLRREQARRAARTEVGLDDLGRADLGAVPAPHADAGEARFVQ